MKKTFLIAAAALSMVPAFSQNLIKSFQDPKLNFVDMKPGSFMMGRADGDEDEKTVHKVTLSGFKIANIEVTQDLYESVIGSLPEGCVKGSHGKRLPVNNLTWEQAVDFCNKLSQKEKLDQVYEKVDGQWVWHKDRYGFRLPTEAEWEYAAREGGTKAGSLNKFSGSSNADDVGWIKSNSDAAVRAVGQKKPNALGLYDMTGNVAEWCWDWWAKKSYSAASETKDPTGISKGTKRVIRGGDVTTDERKSEVAARDAYLPDSYKHTTIGFRIVYQEGREYARKKYIQNIQAVLVKGGTFVMGDDKKGASDAKPAHKVTVNGFYMQTTEVTQGEYKRVMGTNPSKYKGSSDLPVNEITFDMAIEYCNALSKKCGLNPCYTKKGSDWVFDQKANGWRLPTEAEWEYAAREAGSKGGTVNQYSGSNKIDDVGWVDSNSGFMRNVASLKPNALGIYDLTGNVFEWCWDWWSSKTYADKKQTNNPVGPASGKSRVQRGGAAYSDGSEDYGAGYVYERMALQPEKTDDGCGIRVVRNEK